MLTLYFAPGSSSFAVHIALHEIGAPFEARPMSFTKNDMRAPDYLALNPEGKVPTLLIDGRPLDRGRGDPVLSRRRFPEAELLPRDDIEAEAQAVSWMSFIASTLHPARRHGLDHAREVYAIADRRLGSGWAIGPLFDRRHPSVPAVLADIANSLKPAPANFPTSRRALRAHDGNGPRCSKTIEIEAAIGYELPA